jgi:hypothetical protein
MKKIFLYFLMTIVFSGCFKDNDNKAPLAETTSFFEISYSDLTGLGSARAYFQKDYNVAVPNDISKILLNDVEMPFIKQVSEYQSVFNNLMVDTANFRVVTKKGQELTVQAILVPIGLHPSLPDSISASNDITLKWYGDIVYPGETITVYLNNTETHYTADFSTSTSYTSSITIRKKELLPLSKGTYVLFFSRYNIGEVSAGIGVKTYKASYYISPSKTITLY